MKIYSLMRSEIGFAKVEVELTLLSGLPRIQILGLPDAATRESEWRIKSAIKKQGFRFPTSQQVIVNLKPTGVRKHLIGVDLAIAILLLQAMGEIPVSEVAKELIVVGHLGLSGEIEAPEELLAWHGEKETPVLTGSGRLLSRPHFAFKDLRELLTPWREIQSCTKPIWSVEIDKDILLTKPQAKVLSLLALGGHSAILAGVPGSGKSTLARWVGAMLPPPSEKESEEILEIGNYFSEKRKWRPIIEPHSSTSIHGILGGGSANRAGELTRAHRGVLILDELLEFSVLVQDGLRNALENKSIQLVRGNSIRSYPADFQFLATTNLCRCGQYVPIRDHGCTCSSEKHKNYLSKISWPLWDRVEILGFFERKEKREISLGSVLEHIAKARMRKEPAVSDRVLRDIQNRLREASFRRARACLSVAKSLARLSGSKEIANQHIIEAHTLTCQNFELLRYQRQS